MSQNSEYENRMLNDFMDKYEKHQTNVKENQLKDSTETINEKSFETCSNWSQKSNPVQSTWSYFENTEDNNEKKNEWNSQPF